MLKRLRNDPEYAKRCCSAILAISAKGNYRLFLNDYKQLKKLQRWYSQRELTLKQHTWMVNVLAKHLAIIGKLESGELEWPKTNLVRRRWQPRHKRLTGRPFKSEVAKTEPEIEGFLRKELKW